MKRNTLTTAVVAGLTGLTGMVSVSNAVNVNPDGMGQVLLYPYYTARGGNDTLISIVNTTERGKAVKVRFIEAMNSREVLDFNLYMSPYDVWTAAIVEGEDGGGVMRTADTSCTVPYFYDAEAGFGEQAFLDFEFTGARTNFDGGPQDIERTASGYIEVIEMGSMVARGSYRPTASTLATLYTDERAVEWASKHGAAGVPADCAVLTNLWTEGFPIPTWRTDPSHGFTGSTGGLFGAGAIVNVEKGTMFSYNATAIDGFWKAASIGHSNPGLVTPDLSSGDNLTSLTFNNGSMEEITWANSVLAVNAVLTLDEVFNEYNVSDVASAATEWVMTFPTRRFHVDALEKGLTGVTASSPIPPFTRSWYYTTTSAGAVSRRYFACEDLSYKFWDREERTPVAGTTGPIVSPPPPEAAPELFQLCKEANVIRFSDSSETPAATEIFGEPARSAPFATLGYTNFEIPYGEGWARFDLGTLPADSSVSVDERLSVVGDKNGTGRQVKGLPVIGFSATTYTNGNIGEGVLANYAGSFDHRGSRVFVNSAD